MKQFRKIIMIGSLLAFLATCNLSAEENPPRVGVINFKQVVEESKLGKQEQGKFNEMKEQMEKVLEGKEKELSEIGEKFNDPDYLDSISPEAETELKRKFRALNQEMNQIQSQYFQALQQAHYKIVQTISEEVTGVSKDVAKAQNLQLVLNAETLFYSDSTIDVTKAIIAKMDSIFQETPNEMSQY